MISRRHRFLFIHVPKTAGNSIQRALLPYSEDSIALVAPHQDGIDRFEIRSPDLQIQKHSTLADYRRQLDPDLLAGLFTFHGIRNPWDRCVSFFFSPHRGPVTWSPDGFERFVETGMHPAETYLQLGPDDPAPFGNADAVIRYEHLAEDFRSVCDRIGIGHPALPRSNASAREDYRRYYRSDRTIEMVARKFAAEIAWFGYRFDPD